MKVHFFVFKAMCDYRDTLPESKTDICTREKEVIVNGKIGTFKPYDCNCLESYCPFNLSNEETL